MCQSTHGNDKNEYSSPEMRAFINKKQNKIVRKVKKLDKNIKKISIPVILHLTFGLSQYSYKTNTSGQKSRTHEICGEHNASDDRTLDGTSLNNFYITHPRTKNNVIKGTQIKSVFLCNNYI